MVFFKAGPAATETDSLGGLWNRCDEMPEADGVDPALNKGDGYMLLWKCLLSFVSCSSGGNKTINQKSGKIAYPGWSVVDTDWDSCRLRIVKLVKLKPAVMERRQSAHKPGKVGLGTALVRCKHFWAVVQPPLWPSRHTLPTSPLGTQRESGGSLASLSSLPLDVWRKPGPVSRKGLWCAWWWRLGTVEDSRKQGVTIPCSAGRYLNTCFDGLGWFWLSLGLFKVV